MAAIDSISASEVKQTDTSTMQQAGVCHLRANTQKSDSTTSASAAQLRILVLSQLLRLVADLLCFLLLLLHLIVPWRCPSLYSALKADGGEKWHSVVAVHAARSVVQLPLDVCCLVVVLIAPWRAVTALVLFVAPIYTEHERALRSASFVRLLSNTVADWGSILLLVLILLTVWRLPWLLSDLVVVFFRKRSLFLPSFQLGLFKLYQELTDIEVGSYDALTLLKRKPMIATSYLFRESLSDSKQKNDMQQPAVKSAVDQLFESSQSHQMLAAKVWLKIRVIILKQACLLLVDLAQLLQIVFISVTIVEFVPFLKRLIKLKTEQLRRNKSALRGLVQANFKRAIKSLDPSEESEYKSLLLSGAKLSLHNVMPPQALFPFLDYQSVCAVAAISKQWYRFTVDERYWVQLFQSEFKINFYSLPVTALSLGSGAARASFRERIISSKKNRVLPQLELDLINGGTRYVVHQECIQAVYRLPHFFALPLKFAGLCMLPVYLVLLLRNSPYLPPDKFRHFSFDNMQMFLMVTLFATVATISHDLSYVVAAVNLGILYVLNLGSPLWSRHVSVLPDILMSLTLPLYAMFQAYLAFLPFIGVASWLVTTASWVLSFGFSFVCNATSFFWSHVIGFFLPQEYATEALKQVPSVVQKLFTEISVVVSVALNPSLVAGHIISSFEAGSAIFLTWLSTAFSSLLSWLPLWGQPLVAGFLYPFKWLLSSEISTAQSVYARFPSVVSTLVNFSLYILTSRLVVQLLWIIIVGRSWYFTWKWALSVFSFVHAPFFLWYNLPLKILRLQLDLILNIFRFGRFVVVKLGSGYSKILEILAIACFRVGLLGELILIPIVLTWMLWSPVIVWLYPLTFSRTLLVPSVLFSLFCVGWGWRIIQGAWDSFRAHRR